MRANIFRVIVFSALLLLGLSVRADQTIKVLGLELGGKISQPINICPADRDKAKSICWVEKPFKAKDGDLMGSVRLPNPDSRPLWAAYAIYKFHLAKDGTLKSLTVRSVVDSQKPEILQSLKTRFGEPNSAEQHESGFLARWDKPDIYIQLICTPICEVGFRSVAYHAEMLANMSAQKKIEAARPVTP